MYIFIFPAFGDVFAGIGVREPQPAASEAFTMFGEAHREVEHYAIKMLKTCKPVRGNYHFVTWKVTYSMFLQSLHVYNYFIL